MTSRSPLADSRLAASIRADKRKEDVVDDLDEGDVRDRCLVHDQVSPENLELWTRPQPAGIRVSDAVAWAHQILDRYKGHCGTSNNAHGLP